MKKELIQIVFAALMLTMSGLESKADATTPPTVWSNDRLQFILEKANERKLCIASIAEPKCEFEFRDTSIVEYTRQLITKLLVPIALPPPAWDQLGVSRMYRCTIDVATVLLPNFYQPPSDRTYNYTWDIAIGTSEFEACKVCTFVERKPKHTQEVDQETAKAYAQLLTLKGTPAMCQQ